MTPPRITSLQNERVKNTVKLRDRRGREKQGLIVIDGEREIARAFEANVDIVTLFVCDELFSSESHGLLSQADARGIEIVPVTRPVMEKMAFGDRAEGILAVARPPRRSLSDLEPLLANNSQPLIGVVEGIEKPGNVGAILRTADGAGLSALVIADAATDLYNPNTIRASLGAIFTLPVCVATTEETLAWLRRHQFAIHAARVDGALDYAAADLTGRCALALGSEAHGLTSAWTADDIRAIRLPMLGKVDSLNVSVTAAILFYEALRQRRGSEIRAKR